MADVKIEGLSELTAAFKELDNRLQRKIGRNAIGAGARVIANDAKKKAPLLKEPVPHRKRGTLRKGIRYKTKRTRAGDFESKVWVRKASNKSIRAFTQSTGKKSRENPDDAYYWWMVEFGTAKTPAQPFMRPAFEESKVRAANAVKDRALQRIAKEAADIGRKAR